MSNEKNEFEEAIQRELETCIEYTQRTFTNALLGLMPDGTRPDQIRLSCVDLCKLELGMVVKAIDRRTGLVTLDLPVDDKARGGK